MYVIVSYDMNYAALYTLQECVNALLGRYKKTDMKNISGSFRGQRGPLLLLLVYKNY